MGTVVPDADGEWAAGEGPQFAFQPSFLSGITDTPWAYSSQLDYFASEANSSQSPLPSSNSTVTAQVEEEGEEDFGLLGFEASSGIDDWAIALKQSADLHLALSGQVSHGETQASSEIIEGSETDEGDKVCYGMLYQVDASPVGAMATLSEKLTPPQGSNTINAHVQVFSLEARLNGRNHIMLLFPDKTDFGCLRENMTKGLAPLLHESCFELEGLASTRGLQERISKAKAPRDATVKVDVNIYGPRARATVVGEELSRHKLWLQRPEPRSSKLTLYPYYNPHFLEFPELDETAPIEQDRQDITTGSRPQAPEERLQQFLSEIHGSLHRDSELIRATGDRRLRTELLEHQERALAFMLERESGEINDKYRLWEESTHEGEKWFIHRITRSRSRTRPEEKGGGVLADEMGMGKSLSLLALLLQTIESGRTWAEEKRNAEVLGARARRYTHATLVIVPSALLIDNWLDEIQIHLPDSLQIVKYHGHSRERELETLEKSDLVITTYSTLAVDCNNKNSPLHEIEWYRVVLDEAHIIRRPSTTFHRTCADLQARSRWCLTGTPIQNRLEDIGALFMFLRAVPFNMMAQFKHSIVRPYMNGDEELIRAARDRLILLYDSLVLRRTRDILKLPDHEEVKRTLTLTPSEEKQYVHTRNIIKRYMLQLVGEHEQQSKFGLFQAHLQLRILCNHGTFQRPFSWMKRGRARKGSGGAASHSAPIDVGVLTGLFEREALIGELGLNAEAKCAGCFQPRPILGSRRIYNDFAQNCAHILCSDCLEDLAGAAEATPGRHMSCPLCEVWGNTHKAGRGGVDGDGDVAMQEDEGQEEKHAYHYFNETGFSTKMEALVVDVKRDLEQTKSIIFSCWTRTLDLVGRHLERENIRYLRIDGDCPLLTRHQILTEFENASEAHVLIMTTGTGAYGLNLTAANRVFIVEPQWNPSVERQAIARAIRLKQSRKVHVVRYVIENTVEREMQSQQEVKRKVAAIGFGGPDEAKERQTSGQEGNESIIIQEET